MNDYSQRDEAKISILMDDANAAADLERMAKAWERAAEAQERNASAWRDVMTRGLGLGAAAGGMPGGSGPAGVAAAAAAAAQAGAQAGAAAAAAIVGGWNRGSTGTYDPGPTGAVGGGRPMYQGYLAREAEFGAGADRYKLSAIDLHTRRGHEERQDQKSLHDRLGIGVRKYSNYMAGGNFGMAADVAGHAMSSVAQGLNKLNDSTLNAQQRMQAFHEGLPIVGDVIRGIRQLADAARGAADALHRQAQAAQLNANNMSGAISTDVTRASLNTTAMAMQGRATYWAGQSRRGFGALGVSDPANLFDPYQAGAFSRQIGIAQGRQGIEANIAEIEARKQGLNAERVRLDAQRTRALGNLQDARGREEKTRQSLWTADRFIPGANALFGVKEKIDEAARARLQAATDLANIERKIKENVESGQQAGIELARERGELAKVVVNAEREKLTVLREQEGLIRSQTQTWGRMTPAQRQVMGSWARQAARNPDSLAIGQLDMLAQVAPQAVQRIYEQRGLRDPGLQELQRNLGGLNNTPMGLGANLQAQQDSQKRIAEMQQQITAKTSEDAVQAFSGAFKDLLQQLVRIMKAEGERIAAGQTIRNNAAGN